MSSVKLWQRKDGCKRVNFPGYVPGLTLFMLENTGFSSLLLGNREKGMSSVRVWGGGQIEHCAIAEQTHQGKAQGGKENVEKVFPIQMESAQSKKSNLLTDLISLSLFFDIPFSFFSQVDYS